MKKNIDECIQVTKTALLIGEFVQDLMGEESGSPDVTEAMWMAMQLLGGPKQAAQVVSYCALKVA